MINEDLSKLKNWSKTWLVDLNPSKTKFMQITRSRNATLINPEMDGKILDSVSCHKHLGVYLNNRATWHDHIESIISKASKRIGSLRLFKFKINRDSLRVIYLTHIRSLFEYCNVVWDNLSITQSEALEKLQHEAARIISGLPRYCPIVTLLNECGLVPLSVRRKAQRLRVFYQIINGLAPEYLFNILPPRRTLSRSLRFEALFTDVRGRTNLFNSSFLPQSIVDWNQLLLEVRSAPTISLFSRQLSIRPINFDPLYFSNRFASITYIKMKHCCSSLNAHLAYYKLCVSPICPCRLAPETNQHFLFECPFYDTEREQLVDDLAELDVPDFSDRTLFHYTDLNSHQIKGLHIAIQRYIIHSKRFN